MTWQELQLMDQLIAYKLIEAQLTQQSIMRLTPQYPQITQANLMDLSQINPINCCCMETFNKINATCAEREQIINYNLNSCVQAYPKVILEKPNQKIKKSSKWLIFLKLLCVLLAVILKFIPYLTFSSLVLKILRLSTYAIVIALSLGICSIEKNQ